jgi:hypothetical protein
VLGTIFGPKTDELTEERKRLNKEELHNLYSTNISGYKIKDETDVEMSPIRGEERCIQGFSGKT